MTGKKKIFLEAPHSTIGDRQDFETKAVVIDSSALGAAAGKAGDSSHRPSDTSVTLATGGTAKKIAAIHPPPLKRKLVGASLAGNPQIDTGLTPCLTVWREPAATMAMLGQKMGKLMKKSLFDLEFRDFQQGGVEPDFRSGENGDAGGGAHSRIPTDNNRRGEFRSPWPEQCPGTLLEHRISPPVAE
jgi:hypothetical protein